MNDLAWRVTIVAVSGAIGALARWGVQLAAHAWLGRGWPIGTLFVNVAGCFVFGVADALIQRNHPPDSAWRLLWLTGFCGAFTTFSTFSFDLVELHTTRGMIWAVLNAALHLGLGLAAVVGGAALGRTW